MFKALLWSWNSRIQNFSLNDSFMWILVGSTQHGRYIHQATNPKLTLNFIFARKSEMWYGGCDHISWLRDSLFSKGTINGQPIKFLMPRHLSTNSSGSELYTSFSKTFLNAKKMKMKMGKTYQTISLEHVSGSSLSRPLFSSEIGRAKHARTRENRHPREETSRGEKRGDTTLCLSFLVAIQGLRKIREYSVALRDHAKQGERHGKAPQFIASETSG